jgi:hypothetical protein
LGHLLPLWAKNEQEYCVPSADRVASLRTAPMDEFLRLQFKGSATKGASTAKG